MKAAIEADSLSTVARESWKSDRNCTYWLSAEFLLERNPNGGGVIAARALLISLMFYLPAIWLYAWASSGWTCDPDMDAFGSVVAQTIPWFGAVFAAVYAALYTRYSAQWTYLAGVYNQMMATQSEIEASGQKPNELEKVQLWKAGFAEDAQDLHLARKKMFAPAVKAVLEDPGVAAKFDQYTTGGPARREQLLDDVKKVIPG
ncbi:hypothetical protein [Mycolicibacter senuensis]|uniref:hypothetical protein n=1 Tax=Mycolicibacter senuensis TaxID=386913 RepID=UPI00105425D0|nr:hypothetical protein [Mycolicibacter senuensis]